MLPEAEQLGVKEPTSTSQAPLLNSE